MTPKYLILFAALPLALSACSKAQDDAGDGSGVSIDFSDDSKFSIKADGFSMDIDLPSITLDSDDFDMNNVDLYPGSQITSFDIEDAKGQGGKVQISFKSPVDADKLADWYADQLTGKGFDVVRDGSSLSGKTDEGDPFALAVTEISAEQSKGVLEFSESK